MMQDILSTIQKSLSGFVASDNLQQTATQFWHTLGYRSNRTVGLTWADLLAQIKTPTQAEQEAIPFVRDACMVFQLTEAEMRPSLDMFAVDAYNPHEKQSYLFVALTLEDHPYKRKILIDLTRLVNKLFQMPVVVLFRYAGKVSIGVINRRLHLKNENKDVLKKVTIVKDIEAQKSHRAHLEILQGLSLGAIKDKYNPTNFNDLHEAWRKTLDTRELNKRFFQEIANWYFWASDTARFPYQYLKAYPENRHKKDAELQKEANQIAVIRMITRLVFVWFIKEKGLINPDIFKTGFLQKTLQDFDPDDAQNSVYYKAILQNLFFATLNKPIQKRGFVKADTKGHKDHKNGMGDAYRYKRYFQNQEEHHIKEIFASTPFLNGGLFECLDAGTKLEQRLDCFTNAVENEGWLAVPNALFFRGLPDDAENKQETDDAIQMLLNLAYQTKNKKFDFVHGIVRILERYKFTVEENTPLETETALDPELLGKIFESLLAYYNPETKEVARKATGSFYTPREVVDYMVEETLLAYLKDKVMEYANAGRGFTAYVPPAQSDMFGRNPARQATLMDIPKLTEKDAQKMEKDLRQLLSYEAVGNPLAEQETKLLIEAIYNLKILDPACGSGAFQLGILHKLVLVLNKLDRENRYIEPIIKQKKQDAYNQKIALLGEKFLPKMQELQTNRDIVAQITIEKLREKNEKEINDLLEAMELEYRAELGKLEEEFDIRLNEYDYAKKLYLIQNCLYGVDIQPVATQIAKLRFFITLVIEQKIEHEADNFGIEPLPNLETKIVAANSLLQLEEPEMGMIQSVIALKRKEIETQRKEYFLAQTKDKKKTLEKREGELREELRALIESELQRQIDKENASVEELTSIIDANRQEMKAARLVGKQKGFKNAIAEAEKKIRLAQKRIEKLEKDKVTAEQLARWNPYNPDIKADFFNPMWIFGVECFDLILGNPPYVQLQKLKEQQRSLEMQNFDTYTRMGDLYSLFYERGFKLLAKNGFLCFITSNKWMRANYGESTRQFFAQHTSPTLLIDFGSVQVFETATVDTNILMLQNKPKQDKKALRAARLGKDFDLEEGIVDAVQQHTYLLASLNANAWVVGEAKDAFDIKGKVEAQGVPLNATDEEGKKIWDISINYGIKTGFNEAFVVDEATKNALIEQDAKNDAVIKPLLRGRDIQAWYPKFENLWLIYLPWHFPLHEDENIKGASKEAEEAFAKEYPILYEHILQYKPMLENRNQAETGIRYEWYALQRFGSNYWRDFSKPKILYRDITQNFEFSYVEHTVYVNNTIYMITGEKLQYLTCFFNSRLFKYCFFDNFTDLGGSGRRLFSVFFEKIPVKRIGEGEAAVFARVVSYLVFLKQQALTNEHDKQMPSFFEQLSEALIFELYFPEEFAASGLSVMRHLHALPALSTESPLLDIRKIYVEHQQDTHPVRQAVYYMGTVLPVQLVQSTL